MSLGLGLGLTRGFIATASGGVAPSNTIPPVLSGIQIAGQTLTCTTGTWVGTLPITYSYVFIGSTDGGVNFTVLQSSASNTYVLKTTDAGTLVRCNVVATNGFLPDGFAASNTLTIRATILDIYSTNTLYCRYLTLQRGAYYGSPCIRVRRSSDNTEQNIGFTTTGVLDTAALLSFVGAGNGFVVTYYDQSTNARHATQTNLTKQAQIVASGALMTQAGLAITDYVAANAQGDYAVTPISIGAYTLYHYNIVSGGVTRGLTGDGVPRPLYHVSVGDGFRNAAAYVTIRSTGSAFTKRAYTRNSNNGVLYYDGVSQGSSSGLDTTTNNFNGYMSAAFGTYTTEKLRGSIAYSTDHDAATVLAITNLLD